MACSRRWRAGRIDGVRRAFPADCFRDRGGCHFSFRAKRKVTKRNAPPEREPVLRTGALCFSVNQGTAPNSLRSNTRASSPLIPLRCSARSRRTQHQERQLHPVDPRHAWMLLPLILTFQSALSEPSTAGPARAKRRGCLSAASSRAVPRRTEERRAPACEARRLAAGGAFLWLLSLRAKKVTPLRRRGNDPPGIARRYQCVGARRYNHPFCRASRYASIRLATPSLPMHSDR